ACAFLFELPVAIYSIIYQVMFSFVVDKIHFQNIEISAMIFTKNREIKHIINKEMVRGVTYWKGMGAYTDEETEVLVTIVSKYEIPQLQKIIYDLDPKAFVIITDGLKVTGGYEKRLI
ncbi:YitT family protein, partial [Anaerorhabdus sp.]